MRLCLDLSCTCKCSIQWMALVYVFHFSHALKFLAEPSIYQNTVYGV